VGAVYPLQICMHPLGICKMAKTNMLISPLKTCDNLPHPHVASLEPAWLETGNFEKCTYVRGVLCSIVQHNKHN
jgi:hypothetical protein